MLQRPNELANAEKFAIFINAKDASTPAARAAVVDGLEERYGYPLPLPVLAAISEVAGFATPATRGQIDRAWQAAQKGEPFVEIRVPEWEFEQDNQW